MPSMNVRSLLPVILPTSVIKGGGREFLTAVFGAETLDCVIVLLLIGLLVIKVVGLVRAVVGGAIPSK